MEDWEFVTSKTSIYVQEDQLWKQLVELNIKIPKT